MAEDADQDPRELGGEAAGPVVDGKRVALGLEGGQESGRTPGIV